MIGSLTLSQLRLLVGLNRCRTLTAAAKQLNMTQSAASHQLAEMERRLGVKLLVRRRNRLAFTELGERALASARLIVEETQDLERAINRLRRSNEGEVRFSVRHYACNPWISRFLHDSADTVAAADVVLVADPHRAPFESLSAGEVDLAISPSPSRESGHISEPLFSEPLLAVLGKRHPLARLKQLEAEHFHAETYATTSLAHEVGLEYDRFMKPAGVLPQRFAIAATSETCIAYVREGLGITCMPLSFMRLSGFSAGVVTRPLSPRSVEMTWYAVQRAGQASVSRVAEVMKALCIWARKR